MPLVRKDPGQPGPEASTDAGLRLTTGSGDERWAAARALGTQPGDIALLAAALAAERDPRVREAILTSLARVGGAESVDAMLPGLRSDDAELRTATLDALRAMPEAVTPRLTELLGDADPDVRLLACELARHIPGEDGERLLCQLIENDPEVNVCAAAIEVLAEVGTPASLSALDRCAARFPDERFLLFSIKIIADRVSAQAPPTRG